MVGLLSDVLVVVVVVVVVIEGREITNGWRGKRKAGTVGAKKGKSGSPRIIVGPIRGEFY